MRSHLRLALVTGLAATTALLVASCSSTAPAEAGDGPKIVTTTTQVTDFTTELLAGADPSITPLLAPGQSVHAFEANAAQLAAIASADAVVVSGAGLESWLDSTLQAAGYTGPVIDASTGIELSGEHDDHDHEGEGAGADEQPADDGHDHAAEDGHDHAADDGHDHAAETDTATEATEETHTSDDGHDHSGANPHIWTSPANAQQMVANIATGLEGVEGVDAELVGTNEAAYDGRLQQLDEWVASNMAQIPEDRRLLVTSHDALHYYDDAYGITFVGSIMPSWDDNAEPSAADLDALIAAIKEAGVTAIFTETQLSPEAAQRIASETGATVHSGDDALYTDALGEPGTPGATYIGATAHNTTVLVDAWGGAPTAVPDGIDAA